MDGRELEKICDDHYQMGYLSGLSDSGERGLCCRILTVMCIVLLAALLVVWNIA